MSPAWPSWPPNRRAWMPAKSGKTVAAGGVGCGEALRVFLRCFSVGTRSFPRWRETRAYKLRAKSVVAPSQYFYVFERPRLEREGRPGHKIGKLFPLCASDEPRPQA